MNKIDLHTHTTASDGIYSPQDLLDHAARNGVIAMAVTDHDTVDGLSDAVDHARAIGLRLYPGVEFSIDYDAGSFHLIGLNVDYRHRELKDTLAELMAHRSARVHRIIEDLRRHGIDIPLGEVLVMAGDGAAGRPHVARVMVNHGYAPTIREIFANYLVKGKPGYVKKVRIGFEDAVRIIRLSGGIPVIAHPISLECGGIEEFAHLLDGFVEAGVEGVEAYAAMHTPEQAAAYRECAERRGLLVTGGSDFHGDKDETIGNYARGTPIPFELYERLEAFLRGR